MNRVDNSGRFMKGDGCTVSALATGNDCSMVFLLPDQGRSVEEFLNTPERLETSMDTDYMKWKSGKVTWKVPKFSFGMYTPTGRTAARPGHGENVCSGS